MRPRLGHIQFLNCLPLYYGLVKSDALLDVELLKAPPRRLAEMLVAGELDAAPIPAIEYARHADDLVLLPDISISSDGEVQSILLVSKVPAEDLGGKTVALTDSSRTSQVLAKILLAKHWGVVPRYAEMPSDLASMMREADAALLIGDDALRAYHQPMAELKFDLGSVWKEHTGLPMVYAVWAVRREYAEANPAEVQRLDWALNESMRYSAEHAEAVAEYAARWEPMPVNFFASYYDTLRFSFGERFREGMMRYFAEAHDIGELERVPELRVLERV
ncbi:MAG TPA: menaquinone biosynthesis protein [Coriobacteriia bacterium]|jgi:chorismate dehydratase